MVDRESIQGSHSEGYGPHGGPLVAIEGGFVEISVFETNTPPRFRLYFYDEQPFAVRVGDAFLESDGSME
jgi:hypothetical protein